MRVLRPSLLGTSVLLRYSVPTFARKKQGMKSRSEKQLERVFPFFLTYCSDLLGVGGGRGADCPSLISVTSQFRLRMAAAADAARHLNLS